jgi:hypothetical protein
MKPEELLELAKKNTIESLIEDKIVQRLNENATQWPRPDGPGWDELSRRSKAFEKMCSPHNLIPLLERYIELEKLASTMAKLIHDHNYATSPLCPAAFNIAPMRLGMIDVMMEWQKFKESK